MIRTTQNLRIRYRGRKKASITQEPKQKVFSRPKWRLQRSNMNGTYGTERVTCFGIEVEILVHMDHCTLVRHQKRELIVETSDLSFRHRFAKAA
jgi:hypothetical protein